MTAGKEQFSELTEITFSEVPVYWAKVLPGQEESFKDGNTTWKVDIVLTKKEYWEAMEDNGFNVKHPDAKVIRAGKKEGAPDKDKVRAETEEARGVYVRAVRNKFLFGKGADGKQDKTVIEKTKEPPMVRDRKNNPWPDDKKIGNGSICNIECVAKYFEGNAYVTLYLLAIQVVKLVEPPVILDENGDPIEPVSVGETFKVYDDEE